MSGIALKVTFLLVRTIAKPIATTIKAQAKEHEAFRKSCIRIAQTLHSTDLKLRMSLLGEKKIKIRPLNDNKAIENGANFLSESFIFSVAGFLIFYEGYRSRKKASDQRDAMTDDITLLQGEIDLIKSQLGQVIERLDSGVASTSVGASGGHKSKQKVPLDAKSPSPRHEESMGKSPENAPHPENVASPADVRSPEDPKCCG